MVICGCLIMVGSELPQFITKMLSFLSTKPKWTFAVSSLSQNQLPIEAGCLHPSLSHILEGGFLPFSLHHELVPQSHMALGLD